MRQTLLVFSVVAGLCLLTWFGYQAKPRDEGLLNTASPLPTGPPISTRRPNLEILRIGHRGAARFAPENTLAGITKALELGFEYIEMDVRTTLDGVPVLLHDTTVDRTTDGTGRIEEMTYAETTRLDAGAWFGPEFAGQRIPRLEEALKLIQGRGCAFWDTKGTPTARMVKAFKEYGFDDDCLLVTFGGLGRKESDSLVRPLLQMWPTAPLIPVVRNAADVRAALASYPDIRGVRVMRQLATPELVDEAHRLGLLVVSITLQQADNADYYERLMRAGVDATLLENIDEFDALLQTLAVQAHQIE